MSFASKLYDIGKSLTKSDVQSMVKLEPKTDANFIIINFSLDNKNNFKKFSIHNNAIASDKCFFTQKVGGSGSGIYYLYPNITFEKDVPVKITKGKVSGKYKLIINTFSNMLSLVNNGSIPILKNVSNALETPELIEQLQEYKKSDYFMIITINGKTLYELMPEIWDNYYIQPCIAHNKLEPGLDAMSGTWHESIGFNPNVKIFTMDNYHDSLKFRMPKHLPLSQESARHIRFGWQFIYENLLYRYNGLQYIILPSLAIVQSEKLRSVLMHLKETKERNRKALGKLKDAEAKITKELEQIKKTKIKKLKSTFKKTSEPITQDKKKEQALKELQQALASGTIEELNRQTETIQNYLPTLTLDILFITFSPTDKSFSIQGTIEEILPSAIGKLVEDMHSSDISDKVTLKGFEQGITYLQDYFNREELSLILQGPDTKKKHIGTVYKERIHLAKLLLEPAKTSRDAIYEHFMYHREYDYGGKKRVNDKGIRDWIENSSRYVVHEDKIMQFLEKNNKLRS